MGRIGAIVGLAGVAWPVALVLRHDLADALWWPLVLVALAGAVVAALASLIAPRMTGMLSVGSMFGALAALVVAPFTGQSHLMPAAFSLFVACAGVNVAADKGIDRWRARVRRSDPLVRAVDQAMEDAAYAILGSVATARGEAATVLVSTAYAGGTGTAAVKPDGTLVFVTDAGHRHTIEQRFIKTVKDGTEPGVLVIDTLPPIVLGWITIRPSDEDAAAFRALGRS